MLPFSTFLYPILISSWSIFRILHYLRLTTLSWYFILSIIPSSMSPFLHVSNYVQNNCSYLPSIHNPFSGLFYRFSPLSIQYSLIASGFKCRNIFPLIFSYCPWFTHQYNAILRVYVDFQKADFNNIRINVCFKHATHLTNKNL